MLTRAMVRLAWPAGLALLTACGGGAEARRPSWTPGMSVEKPSHPVGRNWREYAGFTPSVEQDRILYETTQSSIRACMEGDGYDYPLPRFLDDRWMDDANPLDARWASQFGYHLPDIESEQPDHSGAGQPEGFVEVLEATCAPAAWPLTYGAAPVKNYVDLVDSALGSEDGLMQAVSGAGLAAAALVEEEWSECMSREGIEADDPDDLLLKYSGRSSISDEELTARAADLRCDISVGLTRRQSAAERIAFTAWMKANTVLLARLADARPEFDAYVASLASS